MAHDALARNETTPARRATGDGGSAGDAGAPLPPAGRRAGRRRGARAARPGGAARGHRAARAAASARCAPGSTAAPTPPTTSTCGSSATSRPGLDGGPQRVTADHVLGISAASTSLAQLTIRDDVGRALDLGTGCGVQALHLARHAGAVVATDVNRRALDVTRFNAALNDVATSTSATAPSSSRSRGETLRPGGHQPAVRDLAGDRRAAGLPRLRAARRPGGRGRRPRAPAHLAPGGWGQVLANWVVERDRPWDERLAAWLDPALRRARGAARGARPGRLRRAVAQGLRPPRRPGLPATATTPGFAGSTSRASRRSASGGSTCTAPTAAAAPRPASTSCSSGPTTSTSRSPRAIRDWAPAVHAPRSVAEHTAWSARRRAPGDRRRGRRRGPRGDRAASTAGFPARPRRRHRRRRAGRRLRRRPAARRDPRRPRQPAGRRPRGDAGHLPARRPRARRRGVTSRSQPDALRGVLPSAREQRRVVPRPLRAARPVPLLGRQRRAPRDRRAPLRAAPRHPRRRRPSSRQGVAEAGRAAPHQRGARLRTAAADARSRYRPRRPAGQQPYNPPATQQPYRPSPVATAATRPVPSSRPAGRRPSGGSSAAAAARRWAW